MNNSENLPRPVLPKNVSDTIKTLNSSGFSAYLAGGCVRDFLLGKTPSDYDVATSAKPAQVKKIFKRVYDTGIEHGTVTVIAGGCHIEVTTFRADGDYIDNRRPESVTFICDIKSDLARRDFTVNAIAYHPDEGFLDYFGGARDLNLKIIRCVGRPDARFREDALRMLRAVRFCAVLDFTLDSGTRRSIAKNARLLKNISAERVRDELIKIITSKNPGVLRLLIKYKLLRYFDEDFFMLIKRNQRAVISGLKKCPEEKTARLCALFRFENSGAARQTLIKLRLDNKTVNDALRVCERLKEKPPKNLYETRRAMAQTGDAPFLTALLIKKALCGKALAKNFAMYGRVLKNNDCRSLKQLSVNGDDLAQIGLTGQEIGAALRRALDFVMKNPKNNKKETLLALIKNEKS